MKPAYMTPIIPVQNESGRQSANRRLRTRQLRRLRPDASVLENDEKDRHVIAAAIRSGTSLIVTFNLKHFPEFALKPWGIKASHPRDYLITLYEMAPLEVVGRIGEIAGRRGIDKMDLLLRLGKHCPTLPANSLRTLISDRVNKDDFGNLENHLPILQGPYLLHQFNRSGVYP